jgi:hypothetical protein
MAVRLDATGDRPSITGVTPPGPVGGFTLTAWAYVTVDLNSSMTIARLWDGGTTATLSTSSDGLGGPNYFSVSGSLTGSTGCVVGEWRKVAISASGSSGALYVATPGGSTEVDTGTVAGTTVPTAVTLGGRSTTDDSEWWNGRLAYVRLWSAVLSQAEIEAEWNSDTPVRTSGLWADWPLETHTDLTDHSGNGHHLTAGASALTTEAGPPLPESASGSVNLGATAAVSAAGQKHAVGSVTLSASAAVRTTGTKGAAGAKALGAVAALVAAGARAATGVARLAAAAGLALSGSSHRSGSVTLRATAAVRAEQQGALPHNIDLTATLAPQPGPGVTLADRRWTATLEAQP